MRAEQVNANMRVVLGKILRIILLFIATLIALSAVGLDITLLSVFGGALGVGLGFGLQRIASNYVSGFIILLDKSMQIGDVISVDKHYGMVSDMRSRYMVLSKPDGTHVIIPNESLITTAVVNHSLTEHKGRVQIDLAINADAPLELALQLMQDITKQHMRVLQKPAPVARIKGFSEHGVELSLTVWVADPENGVLSLQSALYMDIWKVFKENKISFVKTVATLE
jgi:small-conductance mechanosensitive channel